MVDPYFKLRQEVHVVRNHCASCSELESQMQHPIKVRAILAYGEGFTYRIEDAKGTSFNINEACLCSSASGHSSAPCGGTQNWLGSALGCFGVVLPSSNGLQT